MKRYLPYAAVAALTFLAMLTTQAFAQDGAAVVSEGFKIDFGPLVEPLLALLSALLVAVTTLLGNYIRRKTGIELNLQNNAILNEAIDRAIDFARAKLQGKAQIATNSALAATAAGYVIEGAPKALIYFKITPQRLTNMILARLGPDPLPEDSSNA